MKTLKYIVPEADFDAEMFIEEMLCQSLVAGGSEGIGEEEW